MEGVFSDKLRNPIVEKKSKQQRKSNVRQEDKGQLVKEKIKVVREKAKPVLIALIDKRVRVVAFQVDAFQ